MGKDAPAPTTNESTAEIMKSLTTYLPDYMKVVNAQVGPQAQTELDVAKQVSGPYAELLNELYGKYGKSMATTGSEIEKINRTGAANTDLEILRGSGGDLAREGVKIDKELNPEYYKTRELQANKLGELLGSINLNDANPEAERLIGQENARSGNLGNSSATSTVSNALSFGSEMDRRRSSLSNALNSATAFLAPSQGNFNPVVTALNRPSTNTGESRFGGVTNPGAQAYQAGNNMFNGITGVQMQQNDINANRRDTLDRMNEVTASL